MTLFSLARRNVLGNLKNYLIYFISMIFSVVIYYTFVSLRYSEEIAANMQKWEGMKSVFTQASIILILFVAVFIWYSNSFFTKKRKKEVGLYALLGVRKRKIGTMLFYENMMMGIGAVGVGIVLGTLLSKLFAMMFLKLLDSTVEVSFSISSEAIVNTLIVFAIIIVVTSIHSYRLIYRFQLVELFKAEQEGEQVPKPSIFSAILAIGLIILGYWTVFQPMTTSAQMGRNFLLIFGSLIAGTYLLFRYALIYILKIAQKTKSRYYKGMNMISTAQLIYRIRGNTRMFTMIALLSALTLCAVTVGSSAFFTITNDAADEAPFSYMHISQGTNFDTQVSTILEQDKEHPITVKLDVPIIRVKADVTNFYYHPSSYDAKAVPIKLISASTYNKTSDVLNRQGLIELKDNDIAVIQPRYATFTDNEVVGNTISFNSQAGSQTLTVKQRIVGRVLPWSFPDACFIVSDSLYAQLAPGSDEVVYKGYVVKDQSSTKVTSDTLMKLKSDQNGMSSYYFQYRQNMESAGMDIFTLGFLGLVFLAATGCMIYFKQLTDANEDKERYAILRKIGVSRKEIRTTIAKQTLFVFMLPLLIGVVHSIMVLKALATIQLIGGNLLIPILITTSIYAAIYFCYFVLCLGASNRIVSR
ncbi:ABC transporter permease [Paenibacillus qinlingensis]|uniref:ABC transport system permease protein n=1 Tax=Paenibacillus qinlingensis TaxID=1837343 RepID=A0ABU1P0Z8_9BACL|nr:ABC transporter permease [Paenibacillus qinlingensis]MDR6553420.1 putative ABC transport system permease protein [Paenibacillus qinlingensis]